MRRPDRDASSRLALGATRGVRARRAVAAALWLVGSTGAVGLGVSACHGWDPLDPFQHDAPEVDEAIGALDAGRYKSAEQILAEYLKTGLCGDAGIGLPDEVHEKPDGTFDLGLTLFKLAEKFGRPFGQEEADGGPSDPPPGRAAEVACALVIVRAIAQDPKVPAELRARAFYLAGNLAFLSRDYKEAVKLYDASLAIVPGLAPDAGDGIGRDAAHNRAVALRRLDDQDAGSDGGDDGGDGGGADGADGGDGSGQDQSADGGGKGDGGGDGGDDDDDAEQQNQGPDAGDGGKDAGLDGAPDASGNASRDAGGDPKDDGDQQRQQQPQDGPPQGGTDDRMLDRLEEAPSYQQQEARARASRRRGSRMEDK